MIIKKLTASFGKFNGDSLELSEGLNIIRAPNESGKSTWCAFIRAMLYGVNTSERDRQGYLSDKNKYLPWSGIPMQGSMELTSGGKSITITRTSTASGPMKSFRAVYTGTAEKVPNMTGAGAGEMLTGATEKVFERTAFIRQAGIRISQNGELEKRIAALVSSGSEQRSYSEIDNDVRSWMRKLRYNKSGSIPRLTEERDGLLRKYGEIERKTEALSSMRLSLDTVLKTRDRLSAELALHDKIEKRRILHSIAEATAQRDTLTAKVGELESAIAVNGYIPTKDDIADIRMRCSMLDSMNMLYMRSLSERDSAKVALSVAEKAFKSNVFAEKYETEEEASYKATFLAGSTKPEPYIPPKPPVLRKYTPQIVVSAVLAVLCLAFVAAGFTVLPILRSYYIPALIGLAAFLTVMTVFLVKRAKSAEEVRTFVPPEHHDPFAEYYTLFDTEDFDAVQSLAIDYLRTKSDYDTAQASLSAAEITLEGSEEAVKTAEELLLIGAKPLFPDATDPYVLNTELAGIEDALNVLSRARLEEESAEKLITSLYESMPRGIDVSDGDYLPVPEHSVEEARLLYGTAARDYDTLYAKYGLAVGEVRAIGDPMVIRSRLSELNAEIERQNEVYDSLEMARSALSEVNSDLQTRFSPVISRLAGLYMSELTGGRYNDLTFDKAFNAMAKANDEIVAHNILSLSEGTADQIYLALRLAMSTLILSGSEPAPLILDDALVNFDNTRMVHALNLLRKLSTNRQIILFTCHNRELEYAAAFPEVNALEFIDEDDPI